MQFSSSMRSASLAILMMAITGTVSGPLYAEPQSTNSSASLVVVSPLSVTVEQEMSFGRLQVDGDARVIYATIDPTNTLYPLTTSGLVVLPGGGEAPLIATIRGEPNRSYRISVPSTALSSPGQFKVSGFTLVSSTQNNKEIDGYSSLDASGTEVIRIGGTLFLAPDAPMSVYTIMLPITVLYE